MVNGWLEKLQNDQIVLLDGGVGSELRRRGVEPSEAVWSGLAARDALSTLREIHGDYIRAGADIITTNTFATTRFVLAGAGLGNEFEAINRSAVAAAQSARQLQADRPVAIAGSMSCFPPAFDPSAYPPRKEERDGYRELANLLAVAGVDLLAVEMIQDIEHGTLALEAALETGLPVVLGLSVRLGGHGLEPYDYPGTAFESVLAELLALEPTVCAIMHTPVDAVLAGLAAIERAGWQGPVGVYPELGTRSAAAESTRVIEPAELVAAATAWLDRGARLLGGCCGCRPAHIAALAAARDALQAV